MDKKQMLKSLALSGLAASLVTGCQSAQANNNDQGNGQAPDSARNGRSQSEMSHSQTRMSEDQREFYNALSPRGREVFQDMDNRSRQKAMDVAKSGCKGRNSCKGLGGCASDGHACTGQNDCKGKGGCKVSGTKAVFLVKKAMDEKRANM